MIIGVGIGSMVRRPRPELAAFVVAAFMLVACGPGEVGASGTSGGTTGSTGSPTTTSTIGTSGATSASTSTSTGTSTSGDTSSGSTASTGTDTAAMGCHDWQRDAVPPVKIALVVDTSASMAQHVKVDGQPSVDPWKEMVSAVTAITADLGSYPEARAQFSLLLMPGPVGTDVCGRSDALDIAGWVSGQEVVDRLGQVVPGGGRSMGRAIDDSPTDANLVVVLTHGAAGCGDGVDPEALDTAIAQTTLDDGAPMVFVEVALAPGPSPVVPDTEPDGVDPVEYLVDIATHLDGAPWCALGPPVFSGKYPSGGLLQCLYGEAIDPCGALGLVDEATIEDVLLWIGGDPVSRVDACSTADAWAPEETSYFGPPGWRMRLCTQAVCRRFYDEPIRIQYGCNPGAPG